MKRTWTGQDLEDFIAVSVWTGLRISDVATFQMDRVNEEGGILVRTTKGGKAVYTEVPDWLLARIRDRAAKHGSWIFGKPNTTSIDVITENWRRKLNKLWAACGPWKVKPTPHRFRHTFARVLLENGVSVSDVANLMGNTERMVLEHYSAWVPGRQERLTGELRRAFKGKQLLVPHGA